MTWKDFIWRLKPVLFFCSAWISLLCLIIYTILTGEWWWIVAIVVTQKLISPFANGIALHRYFAHRSFKTGPWRHKFLLWISVLGTAGGPIVYAATHRHHHKFADKPKDLHSPHNSIFDCLFWPLYSKEWFDKTKQLHDSPTDLLRQKDVVFVQRHYYKFWILIYSLGFIIGGWKFLFLYLLPMSGFYQFGANVLTNMLAHMKIMGSYRTFDTDDMSYNNKGLHMYTGQEGLHNNHHKYPSRYNQAMNPGEFDLAGWVVEKFFDIENT